MNIESMSKVGIHAMLERKDVRPNISTNAVPTRPWHAECRMSVLSPWRHRRRVP